MSMDPDSLNSAIATAESAVADAEARFGKSSIELSYKLDELASALKAHGRLLDAANAAARARSIRATRNQTEAGEQNEKYGDASSVSKDLSAVGWLSLLHRCALVTAFIVLVLSAVIPASSAEWHIAKDLIGSSAAAVVIQLLLFRVKSVPRMMKVAIVAVGSGAAWMLLGGGS